MEQIYSKCRVRCVTLQLARSPTLAFPYLRLPVVLITLDSSKKWSLLAGYLDIVCRYSFCRSNAPGFSVSSGQTVSLFLLNMRSFLSRRLICDVPGKSLGCTTPSNSSLCCISDAYVLGFIRFWTSMYSRTFVSILGSAKLARGIRIDEFVTS